MLGFKYKKTASVKLSIKMKKEKTKEKNSKKQKKKTEQKRPMLTECFCVLRRR